MEINDVIKKLKAILETVIERPGAAIEFSDDANIITDIALDSVEMIEFMLEIEENFGIEINFDELDLSYLKSIEVLAEYVNSQIPSNP
ncbi:acyl carrier protein [Pedobacter hartonius]|uniref:Acyl carrier protein n=1 Tax=Pedobacter hartonius TaxID=425514 RepID=A0A1H4GBF2_9SPHI|nr:acyl carrier protein [Pedobacter hartonius]SEB06966.1 acyl carrier protein [Pedobacter hartonius]